MAQEYNEIPDIQIEYSDKENPVLRSPNTYIECPFRQSQETFMDVDTYKKFLSNCIQRFRRSKTYTNYKHYLYDIGLDRCQLLGNIDSEMATIEMHHNFLNVFDITLLITEHLLKTIEHVTTFDVVKELKLAHRANEIPIVMLSKTAHQIYHNGEGVVLPARMCFGYWYDLLQTYNKGITLNIAQKIIYFIQCSIEFEQENNYANDCSNTLLAVRDHVLEWRKYNEYTEHLPISGCTIN